MRPNICCAYNAQTNLKWINEPVTEKDVQIAESLFTNQRKTITSDDEIQALRNLPSYSMFDTATKLFIYMIKECVVDNEGRGILFTTQDRKNFCNWVDIDKHQLSKKLKELVNKGLIEKDGSTEPERWFIC
jgi:hypothetical protein